MPAHLVITIACIVGSIGLLASRRAVLAGTTLSEPFWWSIFSLVSLLLAELFVHYSEIVDTSTAESARYVAAVTTFCPLMAVLGAKRPQNKGWRFIVVSLWIVLVLPTAEPLLLWRAGQLDIGPIREWFLVVLLLVGLSNYLPTRLALTSLLLTAGQIVLLTGHLPFSLTGAPVVVGVGFLFAGIAVGWRQPATPPSGGWNAVWTDFRNAFGAVWGLRVMERVNATAQLCHWDVRLRWHGFDMLNVGEDSQSHVQQEAEIARTMRTTLRRFVSTEWIDRRLRLHEKAHTDN